MQARVWSPNLVVLRALTTLDTTARLSLCPTASNHGALDAPPEASPADGRRLVSADTVAQVLSCHLNTLFQHAQVAAQGCRGERVVWYDEVPGAVGEETLMPDGR